MSLTEIFSLGVLVGGFVFQVYGRMAKRYEFINSIIRKLEKIHYPLMTSRVYRTIFWTSVAFVSFYYLYLVYAQYMVWRDGDELTKFLVPPYRSIFYVFGYYFIRFGLYYLISLAAALFLLWGAKYFNQKYDFRFFEDEEPYLGALAVFLLGNPTWNYAWIYYLASLLAVAVILSLVKGHFRKRRERLSLRFLWLPVAILVILWHSIPM